MINFVRTHYSYEAFNKPNDLPASDQVAIIDTTLGGIVRFYEAAKKAGVRPIIGYTGKEIYLARNKEEYHDLLRSYGNYEPNVLKIVGLPHSETADLVFTQYYPPVLKDDAYEVVKAHLKKMTGHILIGLSREILPVYKILNDLLKDVAAELGLDTIVVNECYYQTAEAAKDHLIQICYRTKATIKKPPEEEKYKRFFLTDQFIPGPAVEIKYEFQDYEILGPPSIPVFKSDMSPDEKLKDLCRAGWKKKIAHLPDTKPYLDRIQQEFTMWKEHGLSSYFLIMADIVSWIGKMGWLGGAGRGCLNNTNVFVEDEIKDISEICIGDKVICKNGELKTVKNTFKYNINEELINIKTGFGDQKGMTLTKDHKILSVKRDRYCNKNGKIYYYPTKLYPEWNIAENLEKGDYICYPKSSHVGQDIYFDLTRFLYSKKNGSKAYIDNNNIIVTKTGNGSSKGCLLKTPTSIHLDEKLAYTLGVFCGDGWIESRGNSTCFCFNSEKDIDSQNKIVEYMESIGCKTNYELEQNDKKVNQVRFSNGVINNFFKELFKDYCFKPNSKYIPKIIFSAKKEILQSFLYGLIRSDGSISDGRITFTSISKKMIYQIKYLCFLLNIPCGIHSEIRTDTREEFKNRKEAFYARMPNFFKNNKKTYEQDDKYFYFRISDIENVESKEKFVYDFEVDGEHNYTTTNGIVHNSCCGCLTTYLLGISHVDPLKHGLLLERFYNPSRKGELPDIDQDVPKFKRGEIIEYIKNKYGADSVSQIITFATLGGRSALKAVLRFTEKCDFNEMNRISDLFPELAKVEDQMKAAGDSSLIAWSIKTYPERFQQYARIEDGILVGDYAEEFEQAIRIENTIVDYGQHASGIIIYNGKISDVAPLVLNKQGENLMCGLDLDDAQKVSLVKVDILGLAALDRIMLILDLINGT